MLCKKQLIEAILELNPSAARRWLESFDTPALRRYLKRLRYVERPRGHGSYWVRDAETTAVVSRKPAA